MKWRPLLPGWNGGLARTLKAALRQAGAGRAVVLATVLAIVLCVWLGALPAAAEQPDCTDDAMIVFDASGSMSGMFRTGIKESRIDRVRKALETVLPQIERHRKLGLVVYGPEAGADIQAHPRCSNIEMRVAPQPNAARPIIDVVRDLSPAGVTPLTDAIELAAEKLKFRKKPATILLFTDGQETCGGQPCAMVRRLLGDARGLVVHVVNFTVRDPFGVRASFDSTCIADETGGTYVAAETYEELVEAFRTTLGCPMLTTAPPETIAKSRRSGGRG